MPLKRSWTISCVLGVLQILYGLDIPPSWTDACPGPSPGGVAKSFGLPFGPTAALCWSSENSRIFHNASRRNFEKTGPRAPRTLQEHSQVAQNIKFHVPRMPGAPANRNSEASKARHLRVSSFGRPKNLVFLLFWKPIWATTAPEKEYSGQLASQNDSKMKPKIKPEVVGKAGLQKAWNTFCCCYLLSFCHLCHPLKHVLFHKC